MCWVSSKLITWIFLRAFASRSHNIGNLVQGEHPQNSGGIGMGSLFSAENLQYLWNGARYDQGYYWWPIESRIYALSIGAKINDLGWPWRAITHCGSKHVRISEPTTKIWIKIDPYCQRRKCIPMTLVSGNVRCVRNFGHSRGSQDRNCQTTVG